jgi:crotonobetainyl-CoA:carnitine CoA-transferase CaiB-like acyl-CoA transferase
MCTQDTLASLHGVIGVLMALQHRHASVSADAPKGRGQVIDVALYEAVFNCMESLLPENSAFGVVREPAGSALRGIAPRAPVLGEDTESVLREIGLTAEQITTLRERGIA